jgi:choline dehydrogenase-like flavoprotein
MSPKTPPFKDSYDYVVVGAGASGSVVAAELSKTGAVCGPTNAPSIMIGGRAAELINGAR